MSTPLHEKIRLIRETECLSRKEFSDLAGVSSRTVEAIENKGNIPRGDALEKIARQWPRYAYWLLTGNTHAPAHIRPDRFNETTIRFYERISNPRPEFDELMTKAEWFNRLVFLQCSDERNDLYAYIETKQVERSGIKQCILIDGGLNFFSHDSGKNRLIDFASFLESQNRADIIKTSELKLITRSKINQIYENWEIEEDCLLTPDLSKAEWVKHIYMNFTAWKMNSTAYSPKHP